MNNLSRTPAFKKSFKKVSQYPRFKKDKFVYVLDALMNDEVLPQSFKDHPMAKVSPKKYQGCRDIHIAPNIVIVYRKSAGDILLIDIGSHQDLQLTENFDFLFNVND